MTWWKRKKKFKQLTIDNKYKIIPAFTLHGVEYWQFATATDMPTGRGLSAMVIYEEFRAKADLEYLQKHVRAMEILLNPKPGQSIKLTAMAEINANLKERINLVVLPDHVYKLASVHFFDPKQESIYVYDPVYNDKKIKAWKESDGSLDFFLKTPLRALLPSFDSLNMPVETYLSLAQKVGNLHQSVLQRVISKEESMADSSK